MFSCRVITTLSCFAIALFAELPAHANTEYSVSSPLKPIISNGERRFQLDIQNNHTDPIVVKLRIKELTERKINAPREAVAIKMDKRLLLLLPDEIKTVTISLDQRWEGQHSHEYAITSALVSGNKGQNTRRATAKQLANFIVHPAFKDEKFLFANIIGNLHREPTQLTAADNKPKAKRNIYLSGTRK